MSEMKWVSWEEWRKEHPVHEIEIWDSVRFIESKEFEKEFEHRVPIKYTTCLFDGYEEWTSTSLSCPCPVCSPR